MNIKDESLHEMSLVSEKDVAKDFKNNGITLLKFNCGVYRIIVGYFIRHDKKKINTVK